MAVRSVLQEKPMLKKLNANIIVALCASCAIIAFAFYERYAASPIVPAGAFYVTAVVICLPRVFYALLRHKVCRNKLLNTT
jgi:membrane protein YdbS with pleckstrin-like domain